MVSTDLTNVRRTWTPQNTFFWIIFNEVNSSVILIILINLFTLIIYSRYFRSRNNNTQINPNNSRRNFEINRVLNEVIRINNQNDNLEPQNIQNNNSLNNEINNIPQNLQNENINQNIEQGILNDLHQIYNQSDEVILNNQNSNLTNENIENNNTNILNGQIEEEKSTEEDHKIKTIINNNRYLREIQNKRLENNENNIESIKRNENNLIDEFKGN